MERKQREEKFGLLVYLMIGGTAALIEWIGFYFLDNYVGMHYLLATALAFAFSTLCHYIMGNILVFTSGVRYGRKKEVSLVFLVSVIGLLFNLALMGLFVTIMGWPSMFSKMLASAIVVVWNYLARKKWIF